MKKVLQFLLVVLVYSILFMVANAFLPFSEAFRVTSANVDPLSSMLALVVNSVFICFTISYLATNSDWRGAWRALGISFSVFMIASFMTQIETLFFGDAFQGLTKMDAEMIMLAPLLPIVVVTLLCGRFFGQKNSALPNVKLSISSLIARIAVLGLVYMAVYFIFGYFVAWKFEAVRLFYSGSTVDAGFLGQLQNNLNDQPIIYPFQVIRGILFVSFLVPMLLMLYRKGKAKFVLAVCLVYLTTSIVLIIPNALFPDAVRWAHFIEMTSSMLLFGLISGFTLFNTKKSR